MPKLIMLATLKVAHGDFRAIQLLNIGLLSASVVALMMCAKKLRRGHLAATDAFFPLLILGPGNIENLLWAWQLTFVSSVVLVLIVLVVIVRGDLNTARGAWTGGLALALLPLTGATGLMFVPALALWFLYLAYKWYRAPNRPRSPAAALFIGATVAIGTSALYFVGFQRASWGAPEVSLMQRAWSAGQALALGFGLASVTSAGLAIAIALLAAAVTLTTLWRSILIRTGEDFVRAVGLGVYFVAALGYVLALGWTRSNVVMYVYRGWPSRYVLLAAPVFCAMYFIIELYGSARVRQAFLATLTGLLLLLLPLNTGEAELWMDAFVRGATSLQNDLLGGTPALDAVQRYKPYKPSWLDTKYLIECIRLLRDAHIAPYASIAKTDRQPALGEVNVETAPVVALKTVTLAYRMPGASEAFVVWGVNGWHVLPDRYRRRDTEISNLLMKTRLQTAGDTLRTTVQIPVGAEVDWGILITKCRGSRNVVPVWEDLPHPPLNAASLEYKSRLRCQPDGSISLAQVGENFTKQFRYRNSSAAEVYILWRIDGQYVAAPAMRPAGTSVVADHEMATRMVRNGNWFTVALTAPVNSNVSYGTLITRREGLGFMPAPVRESPDVNVPFRNNNPVLVEQFQSSGRMPGRVQMEAALAAFAGCWAFLYGLFRKLPQPDIIAGSNCTR